MEQQMREQMKLYVRGKLEEQKVLELEQRLYEQEEWLQLLVEEQEIMEQEQQDLQRQRVATDEQTINQQPDFNRMATRTADHLQLSYAASARGKRWQDRTKRSLFAYPAVQYVLAAAITLLLLGGGVLGEFATQVAELDKRSYGDLSTSPISTIPAGDSIAASWSERLMEQTSNWLSELQEARFEHREDPINRWSKGE